MAEECTLRSVGLLVGVAVVVVVVVVSTRFNRGNYGWSYLGQFTHFVTREYFQILITATRYVVVI